mmetsp:Transcript_42729/g.100144  ORF Transcript_42729/g.100144 Transcript_42729/m.100144 type:complete len:258 (+) Transcript_42729:553-1326(+)
MLLLHVWLGARGTVPGASRCGQHADVARCRWRVLHFGRDWTNDRGGPRFRCAAGDARADARARHSEAAAGLLPLAATAAADALLLRPGPHPCDWAQGVGRLLDVRAHLGEHRRLPRALRAGAPHHHSDGAAHAHAQGQRRGSHRRHRRADHAHAARVPHPLPRALLRQAVRALLHRRPRGERVQRAAPRAGLLPGLAQVHSCGSGSTKVAAGSRACPLCFEGYFAFRLAALAAGGGGGGGSWHACGQAAAIIGTAVE